MRALSEYAFLQQTNDIIEQRLQTLSAGDHVGESLLTLACRHLCISENAKRARPLLCLYYHWMFNEHHADNFVHVGVAAEFIHAASLLHDDIIDEAETRRGKPSANQAFGNAVAVLAGDYLLTEAFDLLRPFDRALIDQAIIVLREMTKAASLEYSTRRNIHVNVENLFTIARGKTGVLFAWCGFAVGYLCNDQKAAHDLWNVGERIGLLFQMADDIKDFDGDKNLKDVCRDLQNLEPSIPIALAIARDAHIRQKFAEAFLRSDIDPDTVRELKDLVIASGALLETKRLMNRELDAVMSNLHQFDGTVGKTCIDQWVNTLLG